MKILIAERMKNHALNLKSGAHQLTRRRSNHGMTKKNHTQEKSKEKEQNDERSHTTVMIQAAGAMNDFISLWMDGWTHIEKNNTSYECSQFGRSYFANKTEEYP